MSLRWSAHVIGDSASFVRQLREVIRRAKRKSTVVFAGIGLPELVNDAFGPLVAEKIRGIIEFPVHGGVWNPITNSTFDVQLERIFETYTTPYIIGIDARWTLDSSRWGGIEFISDEERMRNLTFGSNENRGRIRSLIVCHLPSIHSQWLRCEDIQECVDLTVRLIDEAVQTTPRFQYATELTVGEEVRDRGNLQNRIWVQRDIAVMEVLPPRRNHWISVPTVVDRENVRELLRVRTWTVQANLDAYRRNGRVPTYVRRSQRRGDRGLPYHLHRLLAMSAIQRNDDGYVVHHKYHNTLDQRLRYLAWVSPKEDKKALAIGGSGISRAVCYAAERPYGSDVLGTVERQPVEYWLFYDMVLLISRKGQYIDRVAVVEPEHLLTLRLYPVEKSVARWPVIIYRCGDVVPELAPVERVAWFLSVEKTGHRFPLRCFSA